MNKKIISVLSVFLSIIILLIAVPALNAGAQNGEKIVWNGKTDESFASGSGTNNDPYIIETAEQLAYFAASKSTFEDEYIKLVNDIYLNDTADFADWENNAPANEWMPVASNSGSFKGSFDGGNHTLYGLYFNDNKSNIGLFSKVSSGTIKCINIKDSYLKGEDSIGGIAGSANNSVITNCRSEADVYGENYVGGITGHLFKSETSCCSNSGDIFGNEYIGGVAGYFYSVTESIESYVNPFFSSGLIADCYNSGNVKGSYAVGGICGALEQIGFDWDVGNWDYVSCFTPCIERVYNIGDVKPNSGKIVGTADNGHSSVVYYVDGYFLQKDLSQYELGFGSTGSNTTHYMESQCIGISADDALNQETYKTFDFENIWDMNKNGYYPYPTLRENAKSHKHEFIQHNQEKESQYFVTLSCYCSRSHTACDIGINHYIEEWGRITEPTCTKNGEKYYYCDVCGYTKTQTIEATGHTEVVDEAVSPTCTKTGLTEGKHCSVCNEVLIAQNEVAVSEHSYGEWGVVAVSKPGVAGKESRACAECCAIEEREISALPIELRYIKIVSLPAITDYKYKSYINISGLNVIAYYNNGNEIDVTEKVNVIGFDTNSVGEKSATVEFEGKVDVFTYNVEYTWWQYIIRILMYLIFWY